MYPVWGLYRYEEGRRVVEKGRAGGDGRVPYGSRGGDSLEGDARDGAADVSCWATQGKPDERTGGLPHTQSGGGATANPIRLDFRIARNFFDRPNRIQEQLARSFGLRVASPRPPPTDRRGLESKKEIQRETRVKFPGNDVELRTWDGPAVQDFRLRTGLSQQDFASWLGFSIGAIRKWEGGQRVPTSRIHLMRLQECWDEYRRMGQAAVGNNLPGNMPIPSASRETLEGRIERSQQSSRTA